MTAIPFELFGGHYYLRQGLWMLCVPVLAWMLFLSPWVILKQGEGRKERAIGRARKISRWLLLAAVLCIAQGMVDRAFATECVVRGRSPDGLYQLEVCLMGGRVQDSDIEGLVRLRSTKDGTILAEAEFHDPSFNNILWDWNGKLVIVGASSGAAFIHLPPTWLDRLRAKLP